MASLLVHEEGPGKIFWRIRRELQPPGELTEIGKLFACVWCISVWLVPVFWLLWLIAWWIPGIFAAMTVVIAMEKHVR